jgi:hypothetical protein
MRGIFRVADGANRIAFAAFAVNAQPATFVGTIRTHADLACVFILITLYNRSNSVISWLYGKTYGELGQACRKSEIILFTAFSADALMHRSANAPA